MVDQVFRNALTDLTARVRGSPIAQQFERVTGVITSFGRSNPLIVTSIAGISTAGIVAVARIRKKRKKAKTTRRKKRKAKVSRKRKKVTHRSPRHKGHKRVSFTTAGGKKVRFLVRGQKRSPKHRRGSGKKAKRFIKGTPEAKRFMAKLRRMKK